MCKYLFIFAPQNRIIMKQIVFATNNKHKIEEVKSLLASIQGNLSTQYEILSLSDINCCEDIPETSDTFVGNARQKAYYVKEHYGFDCFADDSGLEVEALDNEPGVHSARYASEIGHDSEANIAKLMQKMEGKQNRNARFRTLICLLLDGKEHIFEGICSGRIAEERSGSQGFGYDPVFCPEGYDQTFADQTMEFKNTISHRAKAIRLLVEFLSK